MNKMKSRRKVSNYEKAQALMEEATRIGMNKKITYHKCLCPICIEARSKPHSVKVVIES